MLYVEPYGGLCNRMRCIASAYHYAKFKKCKLTIIWCELDELNCSFQKLFKIFDDSIRIINIPHIDEKYLKRFIYRVFIKTHKLFFTEISEKDIDKINKNSSNYYIRSCDYWYPHNKPYEFLQLKPEISKRVKGILDSYNNNIIGVHIRRTDNIVSIEKSPTDKIFSLIDKVSCEYPGCKYYVATDEEEELKKTIEFYGKEKIVFLNSIERRRDTEKGILDAITELYILAGCKALVGSYYSSFTDVAAEIYGIPKYVVNVSE